MDKKVSGEVEWAVGICTGAILVAASGGYAAGKKINTHSYFLDNLKDVEKDLTICDDVRYVRDGNLLTSAGGATAGIDATLWLIGQLYDANHSRAARNLLEYYPAPPYTEEV